MKFIVEVMLISLHSTTHKNLSSRASIYKCEILSDKKQVFKDFHTIARVIQIVDCVILEEGSVVSVRIAKVPTHLN